MIVRNILVKTYQLFYLVRWKLDYILLIICNKKEREGDKHVIEQCVCNEFPMKFLLNLSNLKFKVVKMIKVVTLVHIKTIYLPFLVLKKIKVFISCIEVRFPNQSTTHYFCNR